MQDKEVLHNSSEDIIISMPFDKLFGIELHLSSLISGSKMVIISGTFDTNIVSYLKSIQDLKVTKLILFASDVKLMIKNEVNLLYDMSSVKEILYVGVFDDYNNVRQSVENMFKCRFFRTVYGTTESGVISCLYKTKSFEYNGYSSGQLISGTEIKVIDIKSGDTLPVHRVGQICVKSKQLGIGYFTDDINSIQFGDRLTTDGYFKTNDAGYYDNQGNIYIESKVSDILHIDDQMFTPTELQILLLSHPDVIDTSVIGVHCEYSDSDEESEDRVQEMGSETRDLDLINFINDRVEPIRQIDSVTARKLLENGRSVPSRLTPMATNKYFSSDRNEDETPEDQ
ncbi:unnamed protein product [Oppiella nova]|uniref:AMP-dependent synthetase/ligase domain-containing protein n=1 Tax=Oppiella nova TaxID=334625 RepID=A0A7R9QJP6_9ACAR|nr:unnamed protein product [Oppiella nova]CAG2166363.1 unnamed protein product [Oppiella nova]